MRAPEPLLLVEDEAYVRDSMVEILREEGFEVHAAEDVASARAELRSRAFALVLTDLRLPDGEGFELLEDSLVESTPVVVITGHGTIDDAVRAMKAGAHDFVQKPVEPGRLALVVRRALEHGQLVDEVRRLRTAVDRLHETRSLAGSSSAMQTVRRLIAQVAPTDATVLVCGESGTGKELVAAAIHRESARAKRPLVQVNCAAVPESLFESEFFGHRRGAFSGAVADRSGHFAEAAGGTLVLDEVETLPPEVQAKLLRVLESGEYQVVGESRTRHVDVRVIAITNEDLAGRVEQGSFRADLFWRLQVFPIELPPLREHLQDVPEIVEELLARAGPRTRRTSDAPPRVEPEALALLSAYPWPGNVRELRNVLERALILGGGRVDAEVLRAMLTPAERSASTASRARAGGPSPEDLDLRSRLESLERELLERALELSAGRRKEAAERLGIDPKNLAYYLRKHELAPEKRS